MKLNCQQKSNERNLPANWPPGAWEKKIAKRKRKRTPRRVRSKNIIGEVVFVFRILASVGQKRCIALLW